MQRPDRIGGHNHSGPFGATPRTAPAHAVLNAANLVTTARLCLVPAAVWLVLAGRMGAALAVFVLAGASDALDGWLARRHGGTTLGAWLDPAADKALLVCTFLALAATGRLPAWIVALVVLRDLVIVGGLAVLWLQRRPIRIRPLRLGKLNTAVQIVLAAAVLALEALGLRAPGVVTALTGVTAATTVASGAAYVRGAVTEAR